MLIRAEDSCLLVIDVQERLVPALADGKSVVDTSAWLMDIATRLAVPILVSEQYPRGLGHSVAEIADRAPAGGVVEKTHFSCYAEPEVRERIEACGRRQIVVTGMESHVCVLQSALQLKEAAYEVFVVTDGVASIRGADRDVAFLRLRDEGVRLVSRSMVAFEWLGRAGTEEFREISRRYLR